MDFQLNEYHRNISDEELITDLQLVASQNNLTYVSRSIYEKKGRYSATPFLSRWGTWVNVLSQAGLSTQRGATDYQRISGEELIADIQAVANMMRKPSISTKEYKEYGIYTVQTVLTRFGSWDAALKNANLQGTSYKVISDEDLFAEIERLWVIKGSQPTTTDIKNGTSNYSLNTFARRFGGWRKALKAFIEYVNMFENDSDTSHCQSQVTRNETTPLEEKSSNRYLGSTKRTPRDINLRLRFQVLSRDHFKCCNCGSSPAKDPSVELHVDHIIPWSKGGETAIDNLQTLCSKCNLGKSDLILD